MRLRWREPKASRFSMADNKQTPLKTPAPAPVYNPSHGGTHVDIEPLDPRQGQVIDLTKPHAYDEVLPPPDKPGYNLPFIQELNKALPEKYKLDISGPTPEEYKRPDKRTT